jgi:hypothetical protein
MKTLEERVRAATTATAAEITPGSIPPISLISLQQGSEPDRRRPAPGGPGRSRSRWLRLLVPVAAAAAVVTVIAAAVAVTRIAHHAGAGGGKLPAGTVPLAAAPASGARTARGGTAAASALPPYYVSLEPGPLSGGSTRAVVRATATGKALATITPPSPYPNFTAVTAAADDRTFVLAADNDLALIQAQERQAITQKSGAPQGDGASGLRSLLGPGRRIPSSVTVPPEKFFLLRLDPADGTATLSALPTPAEPADEVNDIALAPDGSRLAIALTGAGAGAGAGAAEQQITVVSLGTGSARTWQGPSQEGYYLGGVVLGANPLSWTADGRTLAFEEESPLRGRPQPGQPIYSIQVRLLDTAAPGVDLWSSRAVTISGAPGQAMNITNAMITPDGTRIVAPVETQTAREVAEYSASTGDLVAVLGVRHFQQAYDGGAPTLFWTSFSGSMVIVYDATQGSPLLTSNGGLTPFVLAEVTGSQFKPLPGPDSWGAW